MIYLDTSAFLKLYIREEGSELVQQVLEAQDAPVPISDVLEWEFFNALRLKVFRGELDSATVDHMMKLFDDRLLRGQYAAADLDRSLLSRDIRDLSRHSSTIGSRTLDVVHVAIAAQLKATRFVTFDDRQADLARTAGLPVTP